MVHTPAVGEVGQDRSSKWPMEATLEGAARTYFEIWNNRDGDALIPLFAPEVRAFPRQKIPRGKLAREHAGYYGTLSNYELRSHPPCTHTHTPFPQGSLRDWDIEVSGAAAVGAANGKIFAAVPTISIEVLAIHVCEPTRTAVCEILVHLGDAAKTALKVADVITFDAAKKIVSLRAYKG